MISLSQDYFTLILSIILNIIPCLLSQSKIFIYLIAVLQAIEARFQTGKFYSWAGI